MHVTLHVVNKEHSTLNSSDNVPLYPRCKHHSLYVIY